MLPIAYRETLVWHVAVNGVMAGCPPEFMPMLIAYTKALADGNYRRTLASTHAWTPFCWINGPVARQLGLDCAAGSDQRTTQRRARPVHQSGHDESGRLLREAGPHGDLRLSHAVEPGGG